MATRKQIAANRRNSRKSTGPRTPAGKARASRNSLRHGLTAHHAVLPNEDWDAFQRLARSFRAHLAPANAVEAELVDTLVMISWRLRRLRLIETAFFRLRLLDLEDDLDRYTGIEDYDSLAYVFRNDVLNARALFRLSRHDTRLLRSFYRTLHEIERLQAGRALPAAAPDAPPRLEASPLPALPAPPDLGSF